MNRTSSGKASAHFDREWLVGWLVGWLVDWLVGWLIGDPGLLWFFVLCVS
jgi:hypothetical protein